MCLDTITERRPPNNEVVKAWKLMCVGATKAGKFYLGQYYDFRPHFGGEDFRVAEEQELCVNERPILLLSSDEVLYTSGFHAYRTREDAEKTQKVCIVRRDDIRVVPVELRGVHTIGEQDGLSVLVAREMRVIEEEKL